MPFLFKSIVSETSKVVKSDPPFQLFNYVVQHTIQSKQFPENSEKI